MPLDCSMTLSNPPYFYSAQKLTYLEQLSSRRNTSLHIAVKTSPYFKIRPKKEYWGLAKRAAIIYILHWSFKIFKERRIKVEMFAVGVPYKVKLCINQGAHFHFHFIVYTSLQLRLSAYIALQGAMKSITNQMPNLQSN